MLFKRVSQLSGTTALNCCCLIPQRDVHPEPQNATLFGIVFVDTVRVRTLRWAHPGWGWTLNLMTSPEKRRGNQWDTKEKESLWRQSRDWSYKDPSQGIPTVAGSFRSSEKGRGWILLREQPCPHPPFAREAFRTVRKQISAGTSLAIQLLRLSLPSRKCKFNPWLRSWDPRAPWPKTQM